MKKSSRIITATLGIICIILTATLTGTIFQYNSTIDNLQHQIEENNNTISIHTQQIENLTIQKDQNQQTIIEQENLLAANNQTIIEQQNLLAANNQTIIEQQNLLAERQNQIEQLEQVITFNTSNLETLVFHVCEKDWIDIPDVNYTYNEILSLNNNTYNIILLPEFEEHQNWTAELEWLNSNFMGKQGIPLMLETFAGSEGDSPITKLTPESVTSALTMCNVKYLRFAEVISWHDVHNVPFPEVYVESMLDFCRTNNLKIFWTEWKTDYSNITEVFSKIQTHIEGYEDLVTVSFSTNSGETEPSFGFLNLDEMFQHWGASIQAWYWDTRYNEPLLNMPISLLVQHVLAAKNIGAEIIQFEPYWYFFENGEMTERLEVLFTMLK